MAEHYRFFDAVETNGQYDREYNAQEFTDYFKALVTTGVMKGAGNQSAVTSNGSNMVTSVNTGIAFILGRFYENDAPLTFTHDTETLGLNRIDRIVIRMDQNVDARHVKAFLKKGTASTSPTPPTLTQNNTVYEISLAQVRITGGQTFIASNAVTDERGTDIICPWAGSNILPNFNDEVLADLVNEVDTKLVDASTTQKGIVQLTTSVSSTSTTLAPTASALKSAYDLTLTKANKTQETPINLTLSNGWVSSYGAKYYKDEFGVVHIQASINSGTATKSTTITTLPVGYRPSGFIQFEGQCSSDDNVYTTAIFLLSPSGVLSLYTAGKTYMTFSLSFRV